MRKALYGTQIIESILAFKKCFSFNCGYFTRVEIIKIKYKCQKRDPYYQENLKEVSKEDNFVWENER